MQQGTGQNQQVADITATASTGAPGAAKFILQCGYAPADFNCPTISDVNKGVGADSCCYTRPTAAVLQPVVTPNTCPNTAIKIEFSDLMDQASFADKLTGEYNIALATQWPVLSGGYRQLARTNDPEFMAESFEFWPPSFGLARARKFLPRSGFSLVLCL